MNNLEDISAFMDGESDQPIEAVLASVKSDTALQGAWRRYHLIGDSLRSQLPDRFPAADLSSRISQALDDEPTVLRPAKDRRTLNRRLLKPAAGMAIAASVALVAIVGLRSLDTVTGSAGSVQSGPSVAAQQADPAGLQDQQPQQSMQPAQASPLARTVSTGTEPATTGGYEQPAEQYRFNSYLINHNEYRANAGVRGTMPYARIVAPHDNNQ